MKGVVVLPRRIPRGAQPQRQKVRSFTLFGVSQWSRTVSYESHKPIKEGYVEIFNTLIENPGIGVSKLSRKTGYSKSYIMNSIVGMERFGLLLYEDDFGKLYPFDANGILFPWGQND